MKIGSGSSKKNSKRKSKTKRTFPFLNQNSSKKTKPFGIIDENAIKLKKAIIKISDSQKLKDFDARL